MTDPENTCDAEMCMLPATQRGVAELPGRNVELRLCDDHLEQLRAGKVREVRRDKAADGPWKRAVAFFHH